MRLGITGATGLIGRRVAELARGRGHEVIGFTRKAEGLGVGWREFRTDRVPDVSGCDAIVNLAGESVVGLWTAGKREAIMESRVLGTRRIVEGISKAASNGEGLSARVLVNGSAIGIYGETGDNVADEGSGCGAGFLAEVCEAWEGEAVKARAAGVRVAMLRTGVVLSPEGGALAAMLPAFKLGLGAQLGDGRQWMSWIHLEDEAALLLAAAEDERYSGPVNGTAPEAVRNGEFTTTLASVLHRPAFLRAPGFALRLGLGEFSAEVLESRRIAPRVATDSGFVFQFPTLRGALDDLLAR